MKLKNELLRIKKTKYVVTKDGRIFCIISTYPNNRTFNGKSKCHPDDNFNEDFGKKLAWCRAMDKITNANYSIMSNHIKEIHKKYQDSLAECAKCQDMIMNADAKVYQCYTELAKIQNGN